MRCSVCNQDYNQQVKFCPNCGAPQPDAAYPASDGYSQPAQTAYVRPDYDPSRNGQYGSSAATPVTGGYGSRPAAPATGQIVFSIINIVCCGGFIGTILGIIALIFAISASSEPNYDEARRKLGTAKLLNIIGICVAALMLIISIIALVAGVASIPWDSFEYYGSY